MTNIQAVKATIADITTLRAQLAEVKAAADGDSNDGEIAALRDACETALSLQGLSFEKGQQGEFAEAIREAVEAEDNDPEIDAYRSLLSDALDALDLTEDGDLIERAPFTPTPEEIAAKAAADRLSDFTVVGAWIDGRPVPVAVIPGDHTVSGGDEGEFSEGLWGLSVLAENAHDAEIIAVKEMNAEGGDQLDVDE